MEKYYQQIIDVIPPKLVCEMETNILTLFIKIVNDLINEYETRLDNLIDSKFILTTLKEYFEQSEKSYINFFINVTINRGKTHLEKNLFTHEKLIELAQKEFGR